MSSVLMRIAAAALVLTVFIGASVVADELQPAPQPVEVPDYSKFTQSFHLPFGNRKPVDFDHLTSLSVRASINGGPPLVFQIDTGSTGVIVGAGDVPNIDPHAPPGSITYSSSGIELDGVWTPVTITFPDSKDDQGNIATAILPVLAVSERKVHPGAVNSGKAQGSKNPRPFMFGVGTGRGSESHQERNPWVNLKEMQAGTMRRGYTITRDGITLGLSASSVGEGYLFEKLKEHMGKPSTKPAQFPATIDVLKDWDGSMGWIIVDGKRQAMSNMLLDTGLTNMMIEFPEVTAQRPVDAQTPIEVKLLSGRLGYSFVVGDTINPCTPSKVTWVHRTAGSMINTGLRALAKFDYLYDAEGGYIGLRPQTRQ